MPALYVVLPVLCILAIAYRYYSAFIAAKVMVLDDTRVTPAHTKYDGANYYPTSRWVLFGHHFAAITGAGPLIGPVLAAQFGYAPGLIWLVAGVCLAGAVHDYVALWASTRRGGRSLAEIARTEIGPVAGITACIAILFIMIIALAGLGIAVVNALAESAWGTFTIGLTIPAGDPDRLPHVPVAEGSHPGSHDRRRDDHAGGRDSRQTVRRIIVRSLPRVLAASDHDVARDLRLRRLGPAGVDAADAARVPQHVHEDRHDSDPRRGRDHREPARCRCRRSTQYIHGGGPIIPGPLFPFVFITIACGAISGFHSLIASGTTPKMVDKESDIRPIGYGAMLFEGLVGVMAIIAATALHPADYFAINTTAAKFATLGMTPIDLSMLQTRSR